MAIDVKHAFVSAKGDGTDSTLVRPSNWNASHNINMATNNVIGRLTAGPGPAEELPATPYMIGLLNTADFAALAVALGLPTTGDAKLTFKPAPDAGWVFADNGSIGDVGSGASYAVLATQALFTLFYNSFSDVICPLQTSTGAATSRTAQGTAVLAFSNKCRMVMPQAVGRSLIVASAAAGLPPGTIGGSDVHTLTANEMPFHTHTGVPSGSINNHDVNHTHQQQGTFNSGGESVDHSHAWSGTHGSGGMSANNVHNHTVTGAANNTTTGGGSFGAGFATAQTTSSVDINHTHNTSVGGQTGGRNVAHYHATSISGGTGYMDGNNIHGHAFTGNLMTTSGAGGGAAFSLWNPYTAWNVMIKL